MSTTVANIPPQFEIVDQPLDTQMTISMGPQHPSTHGVLRLELVLDGESVVKATPDIGYLHTGMEKLFEYRKYQQGIVITDRMDYLNPLGNNLAYVMAVEKLLEISISGRAQTIRGLFCELPRIASYLGLLGTHAARVCAAVASPSIFVARIRTAVTKHTTLKFRPSRTATSGPGTWCACAR